MSTDRNDTIASSGSKDTGESALPPGAKVGEFRIERLIGEGGFGIVYLAYDESLDRTVALKEYMPSQLAERAAGTANVRVRSQRYAETFDAAMRSFINEAKLLARFDHPSLLKVYRFFQANGTAYMAMPFYEGQTLKAVLRNLPGRPEERWLRHVLYQLLDGLEVIHAYECYHRDIAPDNILLQDDTPILLDFGAARRVIGDITRTLTVILKPGYAPIEQYGEDLNLKQGPWTDLYALAGVVHFALTRQPPPASIARAMSDHLEPLAQRLRGVYSDGFLTTIDAALAVRPEDRPQSVAQLRSMLLASDAGAYAPVLAIQPIAPAASGQADGSERADRPSAPAQPAPARSRAPVASSASPLRTAITAIVLAAPAAIGAVWWASSRLADAPPSEGKAPPVASESPASEYPVQTEPPPSPPPPQVARVEPKPAPTVVPAPKPPEPAAKLAPVAPPPRVEVRPAPAPREEVVETPAAKPPTPVARVEARPEPAPPAAPKAEAPKAPPVEVARADPKRAPTPPAASSALTGRYAGRLVADGTPVPVTLQILSVDNGSVSATANQGTGRCEGDYRMTGTFMNDSLRMRSTHSGGRYGDCSFGFRVAVQGGKLVGQTTTGSPLELSR